MKTNKMKIWILLLVLLISANFAFGQDRYIEIEVTDTIMCKIDHVYYSVLVEEEKMESVSKYLIKEDISFSSQIVTEFGDALQFIIDFNSNTALNEFNREFKGKSVIIQADLIDRTHELNEKELDILYRKLMTKGENEALKIAKAMDRNKVELLEVSYKVQDQAMGGFTLYPPLSAFNNLSTKIPEEGLKEIAISKTMVLKYKVN
jgi:hypothetical protein